MDQTGQTFVSSPDQTNPTDASASGFYLANPYNTVKPGCIIIGNPKVDRYTPVRVQESYRALCWGAAALTVGSRLLHRRTTP